MKKTFSALFAAGIVVAMSTVTAAWAGGYDTPKTDSSYGYSGPPYPPQSCYGEKTYNPPSGYGQGCEPPHEWVVYCTSKYPSFDASDGYYHADDGYYYYCE